MLLVLWRLGHQAAVIHRSGHPNLLRQPPPLAAGSGRVHTRTQFSARFQLQGLVWLTSVQHTSC